MKDLIWIGTSRDDLRSFPMDARRDAGYQLSKVQHGEEPDDWKPMIGVGLGVREIRIRDRAGAFRILYIAQFKGAIHVLHAFQKKTQETSVRHPTCANALSYFTRPLMSRTPSASKKKIPVTRGDPRGAFHDLFDEDEAAELTMRAELLRGLQAWLANSGATQTAAASELGITQARISDIKRGKISSFSLDLLVRLAARAGLRPRLRLAA